VDPFRPLTKFSMLLRSLEAGDSLFGGLPGPGLGLGEVFGGGEEAGGETDEGGGVDAIDFFVGRTEWNADPDDGDGDDCDAHLPPGDPGDVLGAAAAPIDDDPGDPAGRVYGENRFCRNRSLCASRCWAPAAAAMTPWLLRLCA
jgi:hypothetical protein